MANKKQNRYKVNIGVSYEKEVYVEADNSYDAIHTVKNILLKRSLISKPHWMRKAHTVMRIL